MKILILCITRQLSSSLRRDKISPRESLSPLRTKLQSFPKKPGKVSVRFGQNSNPFRRKLQSASDKTGFSFGENFWTHHSEIQNILQCNWIFTAVKIKMAGYAPHDTYVRIASHVRMCRSTRTLPRIDTIVRVRAHVLLCKTGKTNGFSITGIKTCGRAQRPAHSHPFGRSLPHSRHRERAPHQPNPISITRSISSTASVRHP